jgi:PAS domain S-box-containing protein
MKVSDMHIKDGGSHPVDERLGSEMRSLFNKAPVTIVVYKGKDFRVEIINEMALQMWGKSYEEVIGKSFFAVSPELKEKMQPILNGVLKTGEPFRAKEFPGQYLRNGEIYTGYFDFIFQPAKDENGDVIEILAMGTEVTDSVIARKKVADSEMRYNMMLMESPFAFAIFKGIDMVISLANQSMKEVLGKGNDIEGKPLLEVLPELKGQPFPDYLKAVYTTGVPFTANEALAKLRRNGKLEDVYFNFVYQPYREVDNSILGITCIAYDVTNEVLAKRIIEENENKYRELSSSLEVKVNQRTHELIEQKDFLETIINTTPDLIAAYDREMRIIDFNKKCEDFFHLKKEDVIGKRYADVFPDSVNSRGYKDLIRALNGESILNANFQSEITGRHYQNSVIPIKDDKGNVNVVIGIAHDITDVIEANETLRQSEEKFNKLFNASPLGMTLSEISSGKLLDVNEVYLKMVGYSREEYIGRTSLELNIIGKVDSKNIIDELHKRGSVKDIEMEIKKNSGEKIPILNSIETITIGDQQYFLSAVIDISDRKKSELTIQQRNIELKKINEEFRYASKSLAKSEERYRSMIKEVKDYAILFLNRDGIIENWNEGAEKIKGYKAEEIIGKSFSVFYPLSDVQNRLPEKLLNEAVKSGKANHEGWRVRKDGTKFWGSILITAIHDEKNTVIGFSKVTRDLTDRKLAEEQIKEANEELRVNNAALTKMNEELKSFAYISSHDLQEPLRKIQLFSKRIIEKEFSALSDEGKDYFNRMDVAAHRMQQLMNDLLAYSRTNNFEKSFKKTNLNVLLDEVKADLAEKILATHTVIESDKLPEWELIPFQFTQVFSNLILNAIKFAKDGSAPHITIRNEIINAGSASPLQGAEGIHLSISDNGIGFPPQFNDKIFGLFQRLHGRSEYEGTGIGLSIVKRIVENHEGVIIAGGEENKGAIFHIYLPKNKKLK